ncbi:MAG: hypothetical protein IJD54_02020 [Clostridia bacterium]|nr:hypothetical protein [Clostridia bacterium]
MRKKYLQPYFCETLFAETDCLTESYVIDSNGDHLQEWWSTGGDAI